MRPGRREVRGENRRRDRCSSGYLVRREIVSDDVAPETGNRRLELFQDAVRRDAS
jgi:hypothetical protein